MAEPLRCDNGHENEPGAVFCAHCGLTLRTPAGPAVPPPPSAGAFTPTPEVTSAEGSNSLGIPGLGTLVATAQGGQSIVYRAVDLAHNRPVAVKVLQGLQDGGGRARFDRERETMGALSTHPGIVTIYGSGFTSGGAPYLVMEYMTGGSLADELLQNGPMLWTDAFEVGTQVCDALQAAHDAGVVHGDVKPENLLRSAYGETKLTDFGVASLTTTSATGGASRVAMTVAHAPPELFHGERATPPSDLYSLGSTIFTLIAGRPPFQLPDDATGAASINRSLTAQVPDLRHNGIPDRACRVLECAMAKSPSERFASAAEMGAALRATLQDVEAQNATVLVGTVPPPVPVPTDTASEQATVAPRPARGRRILVAALVALLLVAAGGIGAALLLAGGDDSADPPVTTAPQPDITTVTTDPPVTTVTTVTSTTAPSTTTPTTAPEDVPTGSLTTIASGDFSGTATGIQGVDTATVAVALDSPLTPTDLPNDSHVLTISFIDLDEQCNARYSFVGVSTVTATYRFDPTGVCGVLSGPGRLALSGTNDSISIVLPSDQGEVDIEAQRVD